MSEMTLHVDYDCIMCGPYGFANSKNDDGICTTCVERHSPTMYPLYVEEGRFIIVIDYEHILLEELLDIEQ